MSIKPDPDSAPAVRYVKVGANNAGQRIDNFLMAQLKGVPKSRIYRMIRGGEVRVNKGRIRQSYKLGFGDNVRIPPVRIDPKPARKPVADEVLNRLEESILFEDEHLIALNKPSGIAVHGGSGLSFGIIEALRDLRPYAPYLELVHRLDRDTSGVLLIAKKRSMLRRLHELLRTSKMEKDYLALVRGPWKGGGQAVGVPLRKNTLGNGERVVVVRDDGKPSLSRFEPMERFGKAALVQVKLVTGRTHQIRVHAQHIEHPVAGDGKYGNAEFNQYCQQRGLDRLFLHSKRLRCFFLESGQKLDIKAPLSPELDQVLTRFRHEQ